jgi:5'-3' exonuclease
MTPCDHEEADTRLLIHLQDALLNGCATCTVRTVDTDVVVILIGKFHHLITLCQNVNIWVAFGTGKNFTYYHINAIYENLGKDMSMALPVFHSFTGCDTTSSFYGIGKKNAWEAWKCFQDVTHAFTYLALHPYTDIKVDSQDFQLLERFTVIMYDKTSELEHVNETRKMLFCQKGKTMEALPPTQDALLQHLKRVVYQSGIWCTSEKIQQQTPSPEGWGWTFNEENNAWAPVWNILPVASKACSELVKCGCKSQSGCGGRCACKKAKWKCTELCSCKCKK